MAQQRGRADGSPRRGQPGGRSGARAGGSIHPGSQPVRAPRQAPAPAPPVDRERLEAVVANAVTGAGFDLEELTARRVGRRHLIQVTVDCDGGVDLERVAVVSRALSQALDNAENDGEIIPGEYELQVGSPGVDRPLTEPRHWRRNIDRLVTVRVAGQQVTGRVLGTDDDGVELEVDGTAHRYPFADLGPGKVQVEFRRRTADSDDAEVDEDDLEYEEDEDEDDDDDLDEESEEGEDER
jgi:ribosome maturation factor RimP